MEKRKLGRSGILVSPLGLGLARIAGLGYREDEITEVSSESKREAVRLIQSAVDMGVTLFDTAEAYGQGISESILGEALRGRREGVVVVTKFGEDVSTLDAKTVTNKCDASLQHLGMDVIDIYLLHRRDHPLEQVPEMLEILESLVQAGKIRYYGWSTDDVERASLFANWEHCSAIEHRLNILNDNGAMLDLCVGENLASLNRVPLLMGMLTGRWDRKTKLGENDPRGQWFQDEGFLKALDCVREMEPLLTQGGRTVTQGALAWIWRHSPLAIPLPGFRTMEQMQELVQAQNFGPLPAESMDAIKQIAEKA